MIMNREPHADKWDAKSRGGFFVGYSEISKDRVFLSDKRRIEIARDIRMTDEVPTKAPSKAKCDGDPLTTEPEENVEGTIEFQIDTSEPTINEPLSNDIPDEADEGRQTEAESDGIGETIKRGRGRPCIERTGRRGRPRKLYHDANFANVITEMAHLSETSLTEATQGPDADEWLDAIANELRSILKKDAWTIVPRPQDDNVLGSRIVLRNKFDQEGVLKGRKARIVAKGFAQRPGVDYDDAFAPVSRIESVRMMMALAAEHDMSIAHFDVTTAFLNGKLKEKVYMEVPKYIHEGLESLIQAESRNSVIHRKAAKMLADLKEGGKVCLLNKAIYGLRQAGRCWHSELSEDLLAFSMKRSCADPCIFYQGQGEDVMLVATYVDDILVACKNESRIATLYQHLSKSFEMKNLGQVQHCLGMEFSRNDSRITISQKGYITCLLKRFGMLDAKPARTPLEPNSKLQKPSGVEHEETSFPYQELVGSLMYLAICTRPDIAHATNYLS